MTIYSEQYYSSMDPQYSSAMSNAIFKNYYFGAPTDSTKALQIPSMMKLATSGIMNAEIGVIDPSHWEAMPEAQFNTIRQMAKLQMGQNAKLNVHAPIDPDPTGFREQKWAKENREYAVNFFKDVIDKAAMLQIDEKIPVGVNIHASGHAAPPAQFFKWNPDIKDPETGKKVGGLEEQEKYVIDPDSGQITVAKAETIQYPTGPKYLSTDDRLDMLNNSQWLQKRQEISATQAELMKAEERLRLALGQDERARQIIQQQPEENRQAAFMAIVETVTASEEERKKFSPQVRDWANHIEAVQTHFKSVIDNTFDHTLKVLKAYVETTDSQDKKYAEYKSQFDAFQKIQNKYKDDYAKAEAIIEKAVKEKKITREHMPNEVKDALRKREEISGAAMEDAWQVIHEKHTPLFVPVEKWSELQAAQTFSDVAMYSYGKYDAKGKKGPDILVENPMPWLAMGRSEDLARGIKKSRELFEKQLVEKYKLSPEKAKEVAKEKIGATWDIAHTNILRRFGIPPTGTTQEAWDKHFKKETAAIKEDIKHIHLSDNFGFSDMHMAPGMGNVPIKEFMTEMEKEGKLKNVTTILESAGVAVHLGLPPSHPEAMRYFGMPLYGFQIDQNWAEAGKNYFFGSGGYSSGYGKILPDIHFSEYGGGFSQLPTALGGVRESERGRFAGTPMS
jgi:hypothetical protein